MPVQWAWNGSSSSPHHRGSALGPRAGSAGGGLLGSHGRPLPSSPVTSNLPKAPLRASRLWASLQLSHHRGPGGPVKHGDTAL